MSGYASMGKLRNEMTPHANRRMARAMTSKRLLSEKSTRPRIIGGLAGTSLEGHHAGGRFDGARVFYDGHEAMGQLQDPLRFAEADRFMGKQFLADANGGCAGADIVSGGVLLDAAA